ncbi:membrane fusion protein, multidrug efflux system [Rhizobium sp. RU20A]|uniref:efflux RND transporter periplasmic adaptor subunit n=1 Tax=Rhizobium sp. RU20A TaxID=1907412 RepID=UPI000956CD4B|nr:efflux RND transporter periplasmic adaptor subunit [Rhizobium sp. RU20A]SIQ99364.1 membrane fusion protein, multidrug efflux system [Rhizobium sp. RU20A]
MVLRSHRPAALAGFALLLGLLSACSEEKPAAGPGGMPGAGGPVTVGVVTLKESDVNVNAVLSGRVVPFASADIRPRVGGIIESIGFEDGKPVEKGQVLYKIADDSYEATVAVAEAALQKARASLPTAEANVTRYEQLVDSGGTQIQLDNARLTLAQARADVASAEANLKAARIDLGLTEVRAPISGVTSISNISVGTVVTASQADALTTIRQLDPIYVDLTDSSANLLRLREAIASGTLKQTPNVGQVKLTLENGTAYDKIGTLQAPDFTVSQTTGSFSIRVRFENKDQLLLPGMFVRAAVMQGQERGFLLPQLAGSRDPSGNLTARFVSPEGKVEERVLKTERAIDNAWLITEGVKDGDKLIVDGLQRIGTGMDVKAEEVKLGPSGEIERPAQEQAPADAGKAGEQPAAPAESGGSN